MRYQFPQDMTLDEVSRVVERHNERIGQRGFIRAERGCHVVFNYVFSAPNTFPEPNTGDAVLDREFSILRECRGLTFDAATGEVAARKFQKFFNVGEKDETFPQHVDWTRPHTVLDKLDGSMITPYRARSGQWRWHTKMGDTDVAVPVLDHVIDSGLRYEEFADAMWEDGKTPIFEWCSRQQRIVVDYPEDRLVLTAVRDKRTGIYTTYAEMADLARRFALPVVEALPDPVTDFDAFRAMIEGKEDIEGYIVRFNDGHMLKLKVGWYVLLHKTKERIQNEKDVWELVLNDQTDDIKSFMDGPDRDALDAFTMDFNAGIARVAKRISDRVQRGREMVGEDRKRFAVEVVNLSDVPQAERGIMFRVYSGADAEETVRDVLRKATSSGAKVDEARPLCDGVRWDRYRRIVVLDN